MKSLCIAVLLFTFCATTVPQEPKHAPTLQSCTADLNLWTAQIPGWPDSSAEQDREGTKPLTFSEMAARVKSINNCVHAYPALNRAATGELSVPFSLIDIYQREITNRYVDFLERHNLLGNFMQEDKAGKR